MRSHLAAALGLAIISALAAVTAASVSEDIVKQEWEDWKAEHGRRYVVGSQEEMFRMKIWMDNKIKIEKHNKLFHEGKSTFTMAVNKFSDLLNTEFVAQMNGLRVDMDKVRSRMQRRAPTA